MQTHNPSALFVFGTRPEAIKLAPVIKDAKRMADWRVRVCNTGQHKELLAPILTTFGLRPDVTLDAMRPGQGLNALLSTLLGSIAAMIRADRPDVVVAQGDTTTVLAAALAAHHERVPMAHVEAGLRTGDMASPFPEEANRVLVARLATIHLAPTAAAAANLRGEGIGPSRIFVTGNTVVDAVRAIRDQLPLDGSAPPQARRWAMLGAGRPLVLVTGHRRESFGGGLAEVCDALRTLARRHQSADIAYPVHLNPSVGSVVCERLAGCDNIHLLPPLDYTSMVWLMGRAKFIITDSGGIQEEAPELGKPVLVTRRSTERCEAVAQGSAVVVGYDGARLLDLASRWLCDDAAYRAVVPGRNPFGDGLAGPRCVARIREHLGLRAGNVAPWLPVRALAAAA